MHALLKVLVPFLLALVSFATSAQTPPTTPTPTPPKLQQFVYVLKVSPAFHDATRWTARENEAVGRHFARLKDATAAGRVIFAGRSNEALSATFGLVVFEAESEPAARQFMETDPAVEAGVMTATLHPYVLALQRRP
ncbi:YciI family protein [Aquabacterium humicola]|uniref:YciI family protein n=1 Tax=Aquabacterium humicola TaxID=3237377 RepID=UPI002543337C|nr:YciI family protein [Rubrivivax pictus]